MKILAISDLYPPYFLGGYEIMCKRTVDVLKERGNQIRVLTSTYGVDKAVIENNIFRQLTPCDDQSNPFCNNLFQRGMRELRDNYILKQMVRDFQPDVIYLWHMQALLRSLLVTVQQLKIPTVYHFGDYWMMNYYKCHNDKWLHFWFRRPTTFWKREIKKVLKESIRHIIPIELVNRSPNHSILVSKVAKNEYINAGFNVDGAPVIHNGIRIEEYPFRRRDLTISKLKLLYVGRVAKEKGVHIAIEALSKLVNKRGYLNLTLTIVGGTKHADYVESLKILIEKEKLRDYVHFSGQLPLEKVVDFYDKHDILIFPSLWIEPFGLSLIEAMACGLPVVSSATGGNKEILIDEENSLIFTSGDPAHLATQIERLIRNPQLQQKIIEGGIRTVKEKFNVNTMIDRIENYLEEMINSKGA